MSRQFCLAGRGLRAARAARRLQAIQSIPHPLSRSDPALSDFLCKLAPWLRVQVATGLDLTPAELIQEGGQALRLRLEQQTSLLCRGHRRVSLDAVRCVGAE